MLGMMMLGMMMKSWEVLPGTKPSRDGSPGRNSAHAPRVTQEVRIGDHLFRAPRVT